MKGSFVYLDVFHEIVQGLVSCHPRPNAFAKDPEWDRQQTDTKKAGPQNVEDFEWATFCQPGLHEVGLLISVKFHCVHMARQASPVQT